MAKKICFLAPSGYGKSTAIKLLSELYNLKNIKIAEPLYFLQDYFYDYINTKMIGEQDGELLQFLGAKIRKQNKDFLINKFAEKVESNKYNYTILTNDDCRPPDYLVLKNMGFVFVGINGYCRNRLDQTKLDKTHTLEWQAIDNCDYYVDNFGTIDEFKFELDNLFKKILKGN